MTQPRVIAIGNLTQSSDNSALDELLNEALSVLRFGQLMVLPTDTSYVIAVDAENSAPQREVKRLRQAQESFMPTFIVGEMDALAKICRVDELNDAALELLLSGELSVVLPTLEGNEFVDDDVDSVLINMPSNPIVRSLLERFGICQITSAGIAGSGPTVDIHAAIKEFGIFVDLYWDIGVLSGLATTIIDLRATTPKIIRRGHLSQELLVTTFPDLHLDDD